MDKNTFRKLAKEIDEIDETANMVLQQKNRQSPVNKKYFPYIPQGSLSDLWRMFFELSLFFCGEEKVKFLDVGCGTGRILKLAKEFGIKNVHGVEVHQPYTEIGKKIHKLSDKEITVADAFTLNQEFLKEFNVIYTYMPIADSNLMTDLNIHIAKNAPYNSVFVEMLPNYYPVSLFRGSFVGQVLGNHHFVSYNAHGYYSNFQ